MSKILLLQSFQRHGNGKLNKRKALFVEISHPEDCIFGTILSFPHAWQYIMKIPQSHNEQCDIKKIHSHFFVTFFRKSSCLLSLILG